MKTYEVNGFYGSGHTPCIVFVAETFNGSRWYVVEGSVNVNCTLDDIKPGVNVETLPDLDMFTSSSPINSLEDLIRAIEG